MKHSPRPQVVAFGPGSRLPSLDEVSTLWERHGMLDNIRAHSWVVRDVAMVLTHWLREAGHNLDARVVEVGALLHDISKTACLASTKRHDIEGAMLLTTLGYPELGHMVRVHVRLPRPYPVDETMIVYYADKRVNHVQVVDLQQRYEYIIERYGKGDPELLSLIDDSRQRAFEVEAQLFAKLLPSHCPSELAHVVPVRTTAT
ncbi:MAG: HDIG domain-containing protein [Polyangiaceae bacterium]|jgi:putative nucleotidyltransferase with HDIG domain|nr:HDIG domain-containing protein [Polyangiaceae bacterium]